MQLKRRFYVKRSAISAPNATLSVPRKGEVVLF